MLSSHLKIAGAVLLASASLHQTSSAQQVEIQWRGHVEFNLLSSGPLGAVVTGDPVVITARVDASNFIDSASFPTRGYPFVDGSFSYEIGSATLGLQSPFPAGPPPMFVIRNDDPAVDGFFLANDVDSPTGVPLDASASFGALNAYTSVTYQNDPLSSLDILGALGTYDYTGLSVFGFSIQDGPFDPVGLIFDDLTITEYCGYFEYGAGASPANTLALSGVGSPDVGGQFRAIVPNAPSSGAYFVLSTAEASFPLYGGVALVDPVGMFALLAAPTGPSGAGLVVPIPAGPSFAGFEVFVQAAGFDPLVPGGLAFSNGLKAKLCP